MPSPYDTYTSPLAQRNASPEMLRLWSPRHKFNTWRRIWLAVAEAQHELTGGGAKGAPSASSGSADAAPLVTKDQVEELRAVVNRPGGITDDEIAAAENYERDLRHDIMAHVHALGDSCPKARPIIHLGMTSEDVGSNADGLILAESLDLVFAKLLRVVMGLSAFAAKNAGTPTLGFTHFQAAQPLTVGRRAAQWAYDLELCGSRFAHFVDSGVYWLRGIKGATGTQAALLALIGSSEAVAGFDLNVLSRIELRLPYSGRLVEFPHDLSAQTYPRVIDTFILADLASTAAVLHKIATDIRLLSNRKELDEPFEDKQIGSSAMPYKRNPMRCERICGLARFVMNLVGNAYDTAATQWLERTLDDSSNRRLSLPEAFLALDGALDLMHNVASGLIVHEAMVKKNLMAELPFLATENILMACVKRGGDRQHYHEIIRRHAQAAGSRVKDEGLDNDLIARLKSDPAFHPPALTSELDWSEGEGGLLDPMKYIGRSIEQTDRFIKEVVDPLRQQYGDAIAKLGTSEPRV